MRWMRYVICHANVWVTPRYLASFKLEDTPLMLFAIKSITAIHLRTLILNDCMIAPFLKEKSPWHCHRISSYMPMS